MITLRDRRWSDKDDAATSWGRLSDAWRDLIIALRGIPRDVFRDIEFTGPIASLAFAVPGVVTRPRGVSLVSLYRTDTGATSAVTFSWTYSDAGEVTTTAFSALAAATWRATFRVTIGGE